MRRVRGKNIDDAVEEAIVGILDGWSGKLTWNLLATAVHAQLGHKYVRQALDSNERISSAYKLHRQRLRGASTVKDDSEMPPELRLLHELNDRLKAENARLAAENLAFRETFTTWAYNASNRGLTRDYLSTPIPKVDREQTRELKAKRKPRNV